MVSRCCEGFDARFCGTRQWRWRRDIPHDGIRPHGGVMRKFQVFLTWLSSFCLICSPLGLDGCSRGKTASGGQQAATGDQNTSPPPASGSAQQNGSQEQAATTEQPIQLPDVDLSPAGLDELLAPIALYPDPVLAVILQASVDPQQVMDGGNWLGLDQNQNLKEAALDQASQKAGFTPVMQALLHYPSVVDMMCTEFDWTKLGAAHRRIPSRFSCPSNGCAQLLWTMVLSRHRRK